MASIEVKEAQEGKAYKHYLDAPYRIQGGNPVWVPPLRVQQKEVHDPKKYPFWNHAQERRFVAYRDGELCGRISAISDDVHNRTHHETSTHFGFFESADDPEVARALLDAVEQTARDWGHNLVRGPFNPSINEDIGIQIDAFDKSNMIMMPYNPPYYADLLEASGYEKAMDLYCYYVDQESMSPKLKRSAEAIRKRSKLHYRTFDKKNLMRDALKIWDVYNRAWEKNWCAAPMTEEEFKHLVKNLKTVADFDIIFLAEDDDDRLAGFSLALPNLNEAIGKIRNGRLFPFGLPRLLWHTRKGAIKSVRIIIMGVLDEYRGRGVDAVFYYDHFMQGIRKGYYWGEMSWILETNTMMNRAAEMMGGKRYKTYRMFAKGL